MTRESSAYEALASTLVRSLGINVPWALAVGLASSCGSDATNTTGSRNLDIVSSTDASVNLDAEEDPDATPEAAADVVLPGDGITPPNDGESLEDVLARSDAAQGDLDAEGDVATATEVDEPDTAELDTAELDTGDPDALTEGGEPGGPAWTIQGGCATPLPFVSKACELVSCDASETCVGDGQCVPTDSYLVDGASAAVQAYPAVATREDGAFAVAWAQGNFFENTQQVVFRVFGPDGEAVSSTITVGGDGVAQGRAPSVTAMADGSWLVLWRSDGFDVGSMTYRARRILADGSAPAADAFDANLTPLSDADGSGTNVIAPVVVRLRNDQLIMAWSGTPAVGGPMRIFARLFDADGVATTDDLELSDPSTGLHASSVSIARLPAGLAFVSWQNGVSGTKNDQVVRGRTVDGQGLLGPELALSPGLKPYEALASVAAYDEGELLVTHKVSDISGSTSAVIIRGQLFPDGIEDAQAGFEGAAIVDLDFDANGTYPSAAPIAMLSPERAVSVWQDQGLSPRLVWFKRHYRAANVWDCERSNAGGDPILNEAGDRFLPAIAAWPDGHFIVAYTTQLTGFDETRAAVRILPY